MPEVIFREHDFADRASRYVHDAFVIRLTTAGVPCARG